MLNVRGSIHLEIKLTKRNICLMHPMSSCWYNRCLRAFASLLQPAAPRSSKYNFDEISKDFRKSDPLCSFVQVLAFHVFTPMALLQCLRLWNIKSKSLKTVQLKIHRQLLLEEGNKLSYLIFVIFFTRTKFLKNKIYTKKRQFFALNL